MLVLDDHNGSSTDQLNKKKKQLSKDHSVLSCVHVHRLAEEIIHNFSALVGYYTGLSCANEMDLSEGCFIMFEGLKHLTFLVSTVQGH